MKAITSAVTKANEVLVALEKVTDGFTTAEGLALVDIRILKDSFHAVIEAVAAEQGDTKKTRKPRGPNKAKVEPAKDTPPTEGKGKTAAPSVKEPATISDKEAEKESGLDDEEEEGQLDIEREVAKKASVKHPSPEKNMPKVSKQKSPTALFS